MVNKGRIHREIEIFERSFGIRSNRMINWDEKLGKMIDLERGPEDKSTESKINEFDFDFAEKSKIEQRGFF